MNQTNTARSQKHHDLYFSIIIPAYNAEKTIPETLNSVLSQTYKKFEVIIIDDGSTDNTLTIIQKYASLDSRIKCFCNENNSGVSFTRNLAITKASYDWIAFLDSDDLWDKTKLEKQVRLIRKYPDTDLCYTGIVYFRGNIHNSVYIHVPKELSYKQMLRKNLIPCSSVTLNKNCFKNYSFKHDDAHEDYLLWLKLLKRGKKMRGIDEPLLLYRINQNSKSSNKKKAAIMTYRTFCYIGLGKIEALYRMIGYTIRSLIKYTVIFRRLKK